MRIAIYARVSTNKQNLDMQKDAAYKWIEGMEKSPQSVKIFKDKMGGKKENRPGYCDLLAACERKEIDMILCYAVDRFSRTAMNLVKTVLKLEEMGVCCVFIKQNLDFSHQSKFRLTILAAFSEVAEIEHEMIVARTKDALEAARSRGIHVGRPWMKEDIKERILDLVTKGYAVSVIEKMTKVSARTIYRLIKKTNDRKETNDLTSIEKSM